MEPERFGFPAPELKEASVPRDNQLTDRVARCCAGALAVCLLLVGGGCHQLMADGQAAEGKRLYEQGNYSGALQRFSQATFTNPQDPAGYYGLGATYHQLARLEKRPEYYQQAENYYNQCLDHAANHVECHRALAVLLTEQQRSQEAFRLMQGWVDQSPTLADARIELARLYEEFGDRESSKTNLQSALGIEPYNARALAALGRIYEQSGDAQQALATYERSLESNHLQPNVASRVAALRNALLPQRELGYPVAIPGGAQVASPQPTPAAPLQR